MLWLEPPSKVISERHPRSHVLPFAHLRSWQVFGIHFPFMNTRENENHTCNVIGALRFHFESGNWGEGVSWFEYLCDREDIDVF